MIDPLPVGTVVNVDWQSSMSDYALYFRDGGGYVGEVVEVDPDQDNPGYYDHLVKFKSGALFWFCRFDLTPVDNVL